MPRQTRLDAPGVLQHVMARGIERRTDLQGGGLIRSSEGNKAGLLGGKKEEREKRDGREDK